MAIKIGANLAYNGKLPNFERDSFKTKAAMKAFDENSIDEGHLSYCEEDGNIYEYKSANAVDATTGRWRLFKTEADAVLNGTSTNAIQNKAVFDALKLKADVVALNAYQPKYNADYVAINDLTEIPITEGIIDLNGHMLDMSSVNNEAVSLTIMNGCIRFTKDVVIKLSTLTFNNITIEDALGSAKKIQISVDTLEFINVISHTREAFNMRVDDSISSPSITKVYNSNIAGTITGYTMYLYQSAIHLISPDSNHGIKLFAFNSYFDDKGAWLEYGSEWYNCYNGFSWVTSGCLNEKGEEENYNRFVPSIEQIYKDSENAPQTKAVYKALQLKADKTSLAGYQPKYKADYVATKDFNYSELPNNVNVIDLNGYTMIIDDSGVGTFDTSCRNGNIQIKVNGVEIDGADIINTTIDTDGNIKFNIVEPSFYNCNILSAIIDDSAAEFYNCDLTLCTFGNVPTMYNCRINSPEITVNTSDGGFMRNVIIDYVVYKKAIIENGKFIEAGFESDITNSTIPGNAPSCEAVKGALQLKADKTQLNDLATKTELNSKADASALNSYLTKTDAGNTYAKKSDITNIYKFKGTKTNYADLPTTDRVTGDVWNITNADSEHGIKAGDNVAWNGTAWDNLSGTVDLSAYATKDKAFTKDTVSTEPNQFLAGPINTRGNIGLRKINISDIPNLASKYQKVDTNGFQQFPKIICASIGPSPEQLYIVARTNTTNNYKASPDWYFATDGTLQDIKTKIPKVTLDDAVSTTSTNGVENQAITQYVDSKVTTINSNIADVRTSLESTQTDFVDLRNKVNAMPKTVFITQAAYNALTTKDPNTIYYINE